MKRSFATRSLVAAVAAVSSIGVLGVAQAQGPVGKGNPDADAFVCPVLGGQAGEHGHAFVAIGEGDYTVLGPNVKVPDHATNNDGAGSPADHLSPGEVGYSPIWDGLTN
ncbi:MAG: hypothetical protein IH609_18790 [Dehalococcoidia bacterium]|nr:hypothetical protein [Dehalococcoidia bacterium]